MDERQHPWEPRPADDTHTATSVTPRNSERGQASNNYQHPSRQSFADWDHWGGRQHPPHSKWHNKGADWSAPHPSSERTYLRTDPLQESDPLGPC